MIRAYPFFAALLFVPAWISAADFVGAEAVLKKAAEQQEVEEPKKEADPVQLLVDKMKAFKEQALTLSNEEAAAQWLALMDGIFQIPQQLLYESNNYEKLSLGALFQVLPPSKAWDALAKEIDKRPLDKHPIQEQSLRLVAAVLRGDSEGQKQTLATLKDQAANQKKIDSHEREYFQRAIEGIEEALAKLTGTSEEQLAAFKKTLDQYEKDTESRSRGGIEIPDLLSDADEATVAPLIKRALLLDAEVRVEGKKTRRLAAKLALENLANLKKPVWDLVETEADLPLYEGLVKKFPQSDANDYRRSNATTVYLLHLIAANRTEEASKLTLELAAEDQDNSLSISSSDIEGMQKQGFGKQMFSFLQLMLRQRPELPLWNAFITLSAQQGESKAALQLLREAVANPELKGRARGEVESHLATALLAADDVDEGLKVLREMVQTPPEAVAAKDTADNPLAKLGMKLSEEQMSQLSALSNRGESSVESLQFSRALTLARLGLLLKKPEIVEEAITTALAAYGKMPQQDYSRSSELRELVKFLIKLDRGAEAEAILADELAVSAKPAPGNRSSNARQNLDNMSALMWVYYKAGRSKDMVYLLDHSPYWYADDLMLLGDTSFQEPLPLMAAQALADEGKKEEAKRIINRVVQSQTGNDAVYALMLSLGGDDVEARLDTLQKEHRFEERPSIWKAQLQLNQGRLEEAEKTIRTAISIDPSDGEQGKGDRMRAYAVLSEILDKKGDAEQAKIMRGAVEAIRISEDADDWWNAGMLSRAVAMYEEALLHFADAYCIQSRLALRYSELGDFTKAEMHYQRAFELMPESFGRVESHCFGCEGAFKSKRAQNIADKVFSQLAVKMPDKAQVFYLLGYLRQQQDLDAEAADYFRQAVKLDPDYLNAWKKLQGMAEAVDMSREEREKIVLELFRLEPGSGSSLQSLTNLRLLWDTLLSTEANQPKQESGSLYVLAASAEAMAKDPNYQRQKEYMMSRFTEGTNFRQVFVQHPLIQSLGQLLQMAAQRGY